VDILYQDDQIVVVDKPSGLPVLPDGWVINSPYLVKELETQFKKVWIVHRLDKVTSGVMVFALTAEAHRNLSMQFENHVVEKIYHAIANSVPEWNEKVAKHPLRINVGHSHRTVVDQRNGKPSETCFTVLERFKEHTLLEAKPMTGRTHQVRVHAMAIGHPLLGDVLYSAPESELISHPALHARSLTLIHPSTNKSLTFSLPYPFDFESALKKYRGDLFSPR
jgi:RluA family pseudouridine synthase